MTPAKVLTVTAICAGLMALPELVPPAKRAILRVRRGLERIAAEGRERRERKLAEDIDWPCGEHLKLPERTHRIRRREVREAKRAEKRSR